MTRFRASMTEFRQRETAAMDALPVLTRCVFCPWSYEGAAAASRERAAQHRKQAHPEAIQSRRRSTRNLASFRQRELEEWEELEIRAERDKRARLLGID